MLIETFCLNVHCLKSAAATSLCDQTMDLGLTSLTLWSQMFVYEFSFQNLSLVQCEWFTQFLKRYLVSVLIELDSEVHQGEFYFH